MYRMWRSPTCWHAGRWRCCRAGPHGGVALALLAALHGHARQDLLIPELALGTRHPVRCPHGAERRTHVEGVAVVRVGREAGSREGVVAERAVDWNTDAETGKVSVKTRIYVDRGNVTTSRRSSYSICAVMIVTTTRALTLRRRL